MDKATFEKYNKLCPKDRALVSKVTTMLAPGASCDDVELADLSLTLSKRLCLNDAEALIKAISAKIGGNENHGEIA